MKLLKLIICLVPVVLLLWLPLTHSCEWGCAPLATAFATGPESAAWGADSAGSGTPGHVNTLWAAASYTDTLGVKHHQLCPTSTVASNGKRDNSTVKLDGGITVKRIVVDTTAADAQQRCRGIGIHHQQFRHFGNLDHYVYANGFPVIVILIIWR